MRALVRIVERLAKAFITVALLTRNLKHHRISALCGETWTSTLALMVPSRVAVHIEGR